MALRQDPKEIQESKPGLLPWLDISPLGTRDRKAILSTQHFECVCSLVGLGGGAGCIKLYHIFADPGSGERVNSRGALALWYKSGM